MADPGGLRALRTTRGVFWKRARTILFKLKGVAGEEHHRDL
jgi:hypothetical protein